MRILFLFDSTVPVLGQTPLTPIKYKPLPRPPQKIDLKDFGPVKPTKTKEKASYVKLLKYLLSKPAEQEGYNREGNRTKEWRFVQNLQNNLTQQIMQKIRNGIRTKFYILHPYSYWLQNLDSEDGSIIIWYNPEKIMLIALDMLMRKIIWKKKKRSV